MKLIMSSRQTKYMLITATIVTSWNGSMVDTGSETKRPDVNFYGKLQDHSSTCNIEDILIGGKYKDIAVYQPIEGAKTANEKLKGDNAPEIDPKQNKTLLDLHEIAEISLLFPDRPTEHELTINNRKYIQIQVVSINGSKSNYIVESSREVSCRKIDQGPDKTQKPIAEERKLNIIHVRHLWIDGYKSTKDTSRSNSSDNSISDRTKMSESTEKIIDQIEKNVNNLSKDDTSNYEKIKESLLSLLRSLRDQLQKMLSLIKS